MKFAVLVLVASVGLASCSTETSLQVQDPANRVDGSQLKHSLLHELPETGKPAMHAVQNNRLQAIMKQLNSLIYDQLGSEMDLTVKRRMQTEEIARIASELANSEKAIVETLPALNLKTGEEATFKALAEKLRSGALDLQQFAKDDQLQAIPEAVETLTNTCISCHVLFRKSRSLLEKCKDPRYTC